MSWENSGLGKKLGLKNKTSGLVCEIVAIFCAKYPENPNTENGHKSTLVVMVLYVLTPFMI